MRIIFNEELKKHQVALDAHDIINLMKNNSAFAEKIEKALGLEDESKKEVNNHENHV